MKKQIDNAERFFDRWTEEVAPSYDFVTEVDGTDTAEAIASLRRLLL